MIEALVTGTLMEVAETREGKNDSRYTVAKVKATAGDGESLIVNVIAFSNEASHALLALDEGDTLALSGALTPKVWTDKQGNTRAALDLVATQVMSLYHAQQKGGAMAPSVNRTP